MKRKPPSEDEPEVRRLILEKLVMKKHWGHNHIAENQVPKGLPKCYPQTWYHYVKHELLREGLLVPFKEHSDDLYGLNVERKKEIETLVGIKVTPHKADSEGKKIET
jgi:hypothetical protein